MNRVQSRSGIGFDVHRFSDLSDNRPLVLMGITIPFGSGLLGHSDADVMIHALIDAMLGAACLGDIGQLFPDSDPAYKNIASTKLLQQTVQSLHSKGWRVVHADVGLIGEQPKIGKYRDAMRERIAPILGISKDVLNVKATTTEKLGFIGRCEGLAAQAIVTIELHD
ncbi:MAG: 2-C-methyl-D-erythritol 2,4-cyclodiphosphate synthase [Holophagaceae bacterium]|nr:2-C-methyl-D-erythritol 2,4-cyclodiphosphate synthase [Holophagaceae bacterium]